MACGCSCAGGCGDDSLPSELNLYAYVGNDPLSLTDPMGLQVAEGTAAGAQVGTITMGPGPGTGIGALVGAILGALVVAGGLILLGPKSGEIVRVIPDKTGTRRQCLDSCNILVDDLRKKEKERKRDKNGCLPKDLEKEIDQKFNKIQVECELQCTGLPDIAPAAPPPTPRYPRPV